MSELCSAMTRLLVSENAIISPLLMKHVSFDPSPVIPILFLIHERKLTSTHACLFRLLRELGFKTKNVPILIDMEPGIKKAINQETDLRIVGCWRHLKKDIEAWLTKHGGSSGDRKVYVDHVFELLKAENEEEYVETLDAKRQVWSEPFIDYFDGHIAPKMEYYSYWSILSDYLPTLINYQEFKDTPKRTSTPTKTPPVVTRTGRVNKRKRNSNYYYGK